MENPSQDGFSIDSLFLYLFVGNMLAKRWIKLLKFNLALHFLLVLAAEINVVRFTGLQLYKAIL